MKDSRITFEQYKDTAPYDIDKMRGRLRAGKALLERQFKDKDLNLIYEMETKHIEYILKAIDHYEETKKNDA